MKVKTAIVLFCDDFRIDDNPALFNACERYENIIPLYIYKSDYLGRELGGASKVFLHHCLTAFSNVLLEKFNVNLIIKEGCYIKVLKEIVENNNDICAIYFNHSYTKKQIDVENDIKSTFVNLDVQSFKGKLLFEPWEITTGQGDFFKVFTPFSKACLKNVQLIPMLCSVPKVLKSVHNIQTLCVEDLRLLPQNEGNWHKEAIENWSFDYSKIKEKFANFVNQKLDDYKENRNLPSTEGNSAISPYLRFGMLSVKFCFEFAILKQPENNQFVLELLWREFAFHVMHANQNFAEDELRPSYSAFEWVWNESFFEKWKKGQTGYDFVDAGMIELWKTGFMHSRVRMVVASFLIKDLMIDWRLGEKYFWDTLFDACPAVNPFSWQWVFGSGFDAAPYFRIFNPDLQQERFDWDRSYCNKWLENRSVVMRIVDHDIQKQIALAKYKKIC
ncbi:MAG: deoxyribodipyrimidine photolyase phrB [Pseudomonadota bacterium]|jgi:deoxyribodipyrimidine photo-lyase